MKYIFGLFIIGGVIFTAVWMFSALFPNTNVAEDTPTFTDFDDGVTDTGNINNPLPPSPPSFEPLPEIDTSFLSHPEVTEVASAPGVYMFHTEATKAPEFQIEYHEIDQGFYVLLLAEPLRFTREKAEAKLEAITGRTKAELCEMNVHVGTVSWVSEGWAGKEIGLSYCLGGIIFN